MGGHGGAHTGGASLVGEQPLGERKVVLIHVLLAWKSPVRRLLIRALYQTNGGP